MGKQKKLQNYHLYLGLGGILAYLYFVRRTKCVNNIDKPVVEAVHPFYSQTGLIKAN